MRWTANGASLGSNLRRRLFLGEEGGGGGGERVGQFNVTVPFIQVYK